VVGQQRLEGLEHVAIAHVPGTARAIEHRAIVLLGVGNQTGVLHRIEETIAVLLGVLAMTLLQLAQHVDHRGLAAGIARAQRHPGIGSRIGFERCQTAITLAGDGCHLRVDVVEVLEHRRNGVV